MIFSIFSFSLYVGMMTIQSLWCIVLYFDGAKIRKRGERGEWRGEKVTCFNSL
jgi:hypothetical protein